MCCDLWKFLFCPYSNGKRAVRKFVVRRMPKRQKNGKNSFNGLSIISCKFFEDSYSRKINHLVKKSN